MFISKITELHNNMLIIQQNMSNYMKEGLIANEPKIMELQRQQLIDGLRSDDKPITPSYSQDPHLKNPAKYKAWKGYIGANLPSSKRDEDTPNLYITGKFHNELGCIFYKNSVKITGVTPYALGIVAKYDPDTFGLTDESWESMNSVLLPIIFKRINEQLEK